jgi:DNA-binding protein H-NS
MPRSKNTTSKELLRRIDALRQQAEHMKRKERPGVVARIKEAIAQYGLTPKDLDFTTTADQVTEPRATKPANVEARTRKRPSVVKYRDGAGNQWTGYGPRPKWLKQALADGASEASLRA